MKCKAIVFRDVRTVVLAEVEIPPPGHDEVLVRTTLSCISPGTELRYAAGLQGHDVFPFIPGYALVGVVVETGPGVALTPGTRVFAKGSRIVSGANVMWAGHMEYAIVREDELVVIPRGVGDEEASLAALGGIAHRGYILADPGPLDEVAVIGLGPLGQLSARLFAQRARRVAACDRLESRVEIARRGGLSAVVARGDASEALRPILEEGADIVVDVTGSRQALAGALSMARAVPWTEARGRGPKLVIQGSYPDDIPIPYDPAFQRELTVLFPRDRTRVDIAAYFALLAEKTMDVRGIVGAEFEPETAATVYAVLAEPEPPFLTAAFRWFKTGDMKKEGEG